MTSARIRAFSSEDWSNNGTRWRRTLQCILYAWFVHQVCGFILRQVGPAASRGAEEVDD